MNRQQQPPAPRTVVDLFEAQARRTPDAPAVSFLGERLTYRELNDRAEAIAVMLRQRGVGRDVPVGIACERSFAMVTGMLGVLKAGGAYLPLDPSYPQDRLQYMLEQSKARLVLTTTSLRGVIDAVKPPGIDSISLDALAFDAVAAGDPAAAPADTDLCYVIYTSGSTGKPKGVAMGHGPLFNLMQWQLRQSKLGAGARTVQFSPLSFDVSFQESFATWLSGGELVLVTDELRLEPARFLEFLINERIERLFLPFIALQHLAEMAATVQIYPRHLREVITAGEQLQCTPQVKAFFAKVAPCRLHNHYGPSETHVVTALELPLDPMSWPALPSIGRAIDAVDALILDDSGQPVKQGEGELYLSGKALARGYLHRQELTAERFVTAAGRRCYRTGDLAQMNADGTIQFLGRIDGQVKVRGYRIELGEIEVALASHQQVKQVAVTVREDVPGDKRLVAYLVGDGKPPQPSALRQHLQHLLPDYMLPATFVWLESLPRTPSGKIDRRSLPKPEGQRPDLEQAYAAPRTDVERQLAALWGVIIQVDKVGIHDNFFELGGNSLLAMTMLTRFRQAHGHNIPIVKLFQYPTISGLSRYLEHGDGQSLTDLLQRAQRSRPDKAGNRDIAIVGMAGRFPGAADIGEFWQNLRTGKETTSFFAAGELDPSVQAEAQSKDYVAARGVLNDADKFDAAFFGINPSEAVIMDPQQRQFLEVAWEAFEHAGYDVTSIKGSVGVFAGAHNNSYYGAYIAGREELIDTIGAFPTMLANEKDYLATRVTHKLNLKGPGINVQTACSTSLVAVHLAVQSLRQHDCDMALAGGAAVSVPLKSGHSYIEGGMLSRDGHCRSFDADATGTVFSDGAGAVVLKRLDDAKRDGDTIYAVIKGSAINNDGADKVSFTAPSVSGQAAVVAMALTDAGVDSRSISYVEAHGTATPLGDPIEVEALSAAFALTNSDRGYCGIGSLKSNFGHLTAAAGVAGLIKTTLALWHGELPPSLNFRRPNPQIDFAASPFKVVDQLRTWSRGGAPRRAGVSSFGVGGTNAHVVLEEGPLQDSTSVGRTAQILTLSAKTPAALKRASERMVKHLQSSKGLTPGAFADIAYTSQLGRVGLPERLAVVAANAVEAVQALTALNAGLINKSGFGHDTELAFAFPGQGAQYAGMGASLYQDEPVYRTAIDTCCDILMQHTKQDLRPLVFGPGDEQGQALRQTGITQPALFMTGYALAQLWGSWGVTPQALLGHSIGEFVAATLAGVMTLDEALHLVATRGRLMQAQPEGAMLSVRQAAAKVAEGLDPTLSIAAINSPVLCVVAGPLAQINALAARLTNNGVACKLLLTSHAFHSPMMDAVIEPMRQLTKKMTLRAPIIPILSTVTGTWLSDADAMSPEYWAMHLRRTVNFAAAAGLWWQKPNRLLLEVGPRRTLATLATQQLTDRQTQACITSLSEDGNDEQRAIVTAIGQLWQRGVSIDWATYYAREQRRRVALPTYAFEKTVHWAAPRSPAFQPQAEMRPMTRPAAAQRYADELKDLFEAASGIDFAPGDFGVSFLEMGLDSLFLTQVTLKLKKKYGLGLTFRQLLETYTSINALAAYIAEQRPQSESQPASAPASAPTSAPAPAAAVGPLDVSTLDSAAAGSGITALIAQQLLIMQQQLAVLGGQNAAPLTIAAPATRPTPAPTTSHAPAKVVNDAKKAFGAQARITVTDDRGLNAKQKAAFDAFVQHYTARTKKSKQRTERDRPYMADPRVVTGFRPILKEIIYQPVVDRSMGSRIWDIDGNEYVDVLCGFGSNMLGHSSPLIAQAVTEQMKKGYEIGPQHPLAGDVAQLICEFTGLDRAGFCNTGSEAVMGAMRIARTVTGRDKIAIFTGSYHGIFDEVIVRGTKKLTGIPAAAGIMPAAVDNVIVLDYGTPESLQILRERGDELAAIMVEPIQSRRPDFQPREFLQSLRTLATQCGAALIFDEVITGFRLHPRGAQGYFGVKADIASYGKVVGGGMPIGVIAGQRDWMDALDGGTWRFGDKSVPEVGVTYFAGTFVRHPLALAAAKATLDHLKAVGPELQAGLNRKMDAFANELNRHFEAVGLSLKIKHFGSLFKAIFTEDVPFGDLLFCWMRSKGLHIWDGFPCFFTTAHTDDDIKFIVKVFKESIAEMQAGELLPRQAPQVATTNGKSQTPPVPGAKLGRDPNGYPAWYIADPNKPGQFIKVGDA